VRSIGNWKTADVRALMIVIATDGKSKENQTAEGGKNGGQKRPEEVGPDSNGLIGAKTKDGKPVELYTLTNKNGLITKIATYGATVTELHVPDKNGKLGDVVLGFDNLAPVTKAAVRSSAQPPAGWPIESPRVNSRSTA